MADKKSRNRQVRSTESLFTGALFGMPPEDAIDGPVDGGGRVMKKGSPKAPLFGIGSGRSGV
jgi:hypothetical protein